MEKYNIVFYHCFLYEQHDNLSGDTVLERIVKTPDKPWCDGFWMPFTSIDEDDIVDMLIYLN